MFTEHICFHLNNFAKEHNFSVHEMLIWDKFINNSRPLLWLSVPRLSWNYFPLSGREAHLPICEYFCPINNEMFLGYQDFNTSILPVTKISVTNWYSDTVTKKWAWWSCTSGYSLYRGNGMKVIILYSLAVSHEICAPHCCEWITNFGRFVTIIHIHRVNLYNQIWCSP